MGFLLLKKHALQTCHLVYKDMIFLLVESPCASIVLYYTKNWQECQETDTYNTLKLPNFVGNFVFHCGNYR